MLIVCRQEDPVALTFAFIPWRDRILQKYVSCASAGPDYGHDSLDSTMLYIRGTKQDLQQDVEQIVWT